MSFRLVIPALAAALGAGGIAFAEPPSPRPQAGDVPARARQPADPLAAARPRRPHDHANRMWGKGDYLPEEYRGAYFDQWETYHLRKAPEGYRWIRVNRGVYRVNLQDGYIAEAVFGLPED